MNINQGEPLWNLLTACLYGKSRPGVGKEKVFPSSLRPSSCHEGNNFQTDKLVSAIDLPCLAWRLLQVDSSIPHWPRNLHLSPIDEKFISWIYLPGCQAVIPFLTTSIFLYKLSCSHSQGFTVINTNAFEAESIIVGGLNERETKASSTLENMDSWKAIEIPCLKGLRWWNACFI